MNEELLEFDALSRKIEAHLGLAPGRLIIKGSLNCGIPGKGMLSIDGDPPLTPAEDEAVEKVIVALNAALGGAPPIKSTEA